MRQRLALAAATLVCLTAAGPALAIPAFERRYQAQCHFCHEGFPKLNAIGQRFKERGFRMQREDGFDAGVWLDSVPIAMRNFGTQTFLEDADDATSGFFKGEADLSIISPIGDFDNGGLYINIHTGTNPNGEIRGQISEKY